MWIKGPWKVNMYRNGFRTWNGIADMIFDKKSNKLWIKKAPELLYYGQVIMSV